VADPRRDRAGDLWLGVGADQLRLPTPPRWYDPTGRQRSLSLELERDAKKHVLPRWGGVKVARITRVEVDRWILELSEPGASLRNDGGSLAPATIESSYQASTAADGPAVTPPPPAARTTGAP
jgi:hypothetical protein